MYISVCVVAAVYVPSIICTVYSLYALILVVHTVERRRANREEPRE